jgi:peroxiredoxin
MSKNLNPGDVLPDFTLPDENGKLHRLSTLQGDNCMVLMLGRGEHCPRERQHQLEMRQLAQWAPVGFTELVTVLPGELHDVFKMKIATGAYWPYLCDIDLDVRSTLEIDEYTDEHHDYATVPHTLVLAPGLVIDKVYVGYWFWGRPSPYQLWEDLADLHKRIKPDFDPTTDEARDAWAASRAEPAAAR